MSQYTYQKVPFVWEEPKPLIKVPHRLNFDPVNTRPSNSLISVVASVEELAEGTIYYIGVVPKYRGLGFANDLLSKGTPYLIIQFN